MSINRENFEHFIQSMCDCNTCLFNREDLCSEEVRQNSPECLKRLECYITGIPYEPSQKLYDVSVEFTGITSVYIKASNEAEAKRRALEIVEKENVKEWYTDAYLAEVVEDGV